MTSWTSRLVLLFAILLLIVGGSVALDPFQRDSYPDRASVTFYDSNKNLVGQVDVEVAETSRELYTGLSNHDSLGPNEGMLFVHDEEEHYTYTMRGMSFDIDIIFVTEQRVISRIHHASLDDPPGTRYSGRAMYVVEVNYNWSRDHGVEAGDEIRIDWGS